MHGDESLQHDLDCAYEEGFISKVTFYTSVLGYMENHDPTPILKQLIELSCVPLKAVESSFAVDSSGFSNSKFDRCFDEKWGKQKSKGQRVKAHLMCGVNTNVVPSVEITSSNSNDSPYLAPVVDSTAKRFNNTVGTGSPLREQMYHWFTLETIGR